MLSASKYTLGGMPQKSEAATPQRPMPVDTFGQRSILSRPYESPMRLAKENMGELLARPRETISPAKISLQDIPINQYDSVMANSRLEEIRRKYDSQYRRLQEPGTPLRDLSNVGGLRREDPTSLGSESKLHNVSRSTWQSKETLRTNESASKKEADLLAEQVREIRRSFGREQPTKSITKASQIFLPSENQNYPRLQEDPRVESIDKINMKIKQILNCLNQSEKTPEPQPAIPYSRYRLPQQRDLLKQRELIKQREIQREIKPAVPAFTAVESKNNGPEVRISESFISNGESTRQSFISKPAAETKEDTRRHSMYTKPTDRTERSQSTIQARNSVLIGKRPDGSGITKCNGDYILSSGKDLDEEIRKIQQKIKKSEEEKRRLDIKFESRSQEMVGDKTPTISVIEPKKEEKVLQCIDIPRFQRITKRSDESPSFKQLPSFRDDGKSKDMRVNASRDRLVGGISGIAGISSASKLRDLPTSQTTTSTFREEASQRASYGYRRPVPQVPKTVSVELKQEEPQSGNAVETKRLVQHLKQQVAYDEQLRNSKLNFSALNDPAKWNKLAQQLSKHGIQLSETQLKSEFQLSLQEHNPFYSVRQMQEPIDSVAGKYIASLDYWKKQICSNFDAKQLSQQSFRQDRVDLERKGYLTVEDFVRFLNIETGTFYRNRDLILIFRRMSPDSKLTFDYFMKTVCR